MRGDADGIIRAEDSGAGTPVRAGATIVTAAPPTREALKGHDAYVDQWDAWLARRAEEAAEAEGDDEAASIDPLLVEGLSALQLAVDRSLGRLERDFADRLGAETDGLRAQVASLEADRARNRAMARRDDARTK
jgi:hypothetical protein